MTAASRLLAFAALLAVVFATAALAGDAIDPDPVGGGDPHEEAAVSDGHEPADNAGGHGSTVTESGGAEQAAPVRGLAVAEDGLALRVADTTVRAGRPVVLRFRVVDRSERAVTRFDLEHERRMHLIIVRRDANGFQHLHPRMRADGTWSTRLRIREPGAYRVFADFTRDGRAITLGSDLVVDGEADYRALPDSAPLASAGDGYTVRLDHDPLEAAAASELAFTVLKDGREVHTEPYLGAGGHLVALREHDLAFLHTHPSDHGDDAGSGHSDAVPFESTFPSAGRYRLFLQFKAEGEVRTAAFTVEVTP